MTREEKFCAALADALGVKKKRVEVLILPPKKTPTDPMGMRGYFSAVLDRRTRRERSISIRHNKLWVTVPRMVRTIVAAPPEAWEIRERRAAYERCIGSRGSVFLGAGT